MLDLHRHDGVRVVLSYLWVKLHTSAELKAIRIVVPTVLGELRCGHITSVSLGWASVSCFGIVSGSCAVCYDG